MKPKKIRDLVQDLDSSAPDFYGLKYGSDLKDKIREALLAGAEAIGRVANLERLVSATDEMLTYLVPGTAIFAPGDGAAFTHATERVQEARAAIDAAMPAP